MNFLRDISNKMPIRLKQIINHALNILIIADIIGITYLIIFTANPLVMAIIGLFDLCVCIILIIDFFLRLIIAEDRKQYFKEHWLDLVASIPYDLILPTVFSSVRYLRLIRIIKVLRIAVLFRKYSKGVGKFVENTAFDKILSGILITIFVFTLLLYLIDPTMDIFESLWFVITTLTTVGYGDITPQTFNAKIISLILIIVGVFIFSTITGAISSFFNERVLNIRANMEKDMETIFDEKITPLNEELKEIKNKLNSVTEENQKLHEEISELKELIKDKD